MNKLLPSTTYVICMCLLLICIQALIKFKNYLYFEEKDLVDQTEKVLSCARTKWLFNMRCFVVVKCEKIAQLRYFCVCFCNLYLSVVDNMLFML